MRLLTIANPKTLKGVAKGYATAILHLAPADLSGYCVCPFATAGCKAACLNKAGRSGIPLPFGKRNPVQKCRIERTRLFFKDREKFLARLKNSIKFFVLSSRKKGLIPCVRLNGTSDLPWENWGIIQAFPDVQHYDYCKSPARMQAYLDGKLPSNYHLTFSRSECNEADCMRLAAQGANIAVVFDTKRGKPLPKKFYGVRVVDGYQHDLRFLDESGVVIGLRFKHLRHDDRDHNGFVVKVST
jgi:hypothetical protein